MVELLAPAGNMEKLKIAFHYGADAVYAGGVNFSLRERSDNFDEAQLAEAVKYTHSLGKKIYVAVNIYAHNRDIDTMPSFIASLRDIGVDAIIVTDPGVLDIVREVAPQTEIHLSTQASTTNYRSVAFWKKQGVSRIILARELSHPEIKEMVEKCPDMELEMFIHGAQCMAYSGRCLISNYLADRGANQGDCAQSCRWNYALVEQKRPGEYHHVEEDSRGTYFFNSRDLSLIEHLPMVLDTGVHSVKIEGRIKSIHYTSTIVRAYREAIDTYYENKAKNNGSELNFRPYFEEVRKVSHRDYSTGFFFGNPGSEGNSYDSSRPIAGLSFLGKVETQTEHGALIEVKGKFSIGDQIEIMRRTTSKDLLLTVKELYDEKLNPIDSTKPNTKVYLKIDEELEPNDIVRVYAEIPAQITT